jgi:peroxiredoxin
MVRTESTMLALGTSAPDFRLLDTEGKPVALADFAAAPALVVMFICNHCPFVVHVREGIAQLARDYQKLGAAFVGINSNDVATHPDDSPEKMKLEKRSAGYTFPYLFDETQAVARAYKAACTPDFFVFDAQRKLAYRGQLDGARPGNGVPITGADLRAALDAVLAGKRPAEQQRPSMGCNIKWKPGNEPQWFPR